MDWNSEALLYKSALQVTPGNCRMHHNYATTLDDITDYTVKEFHLREAVRLWSNYSASYANLGVVLARNKRLPEAVDVWKHGLEYGTKVVGPVLGTTLTNIASGLSNMGKFAEALPYWERALASRPRERRVLDGLANAKRQLELQRQPQ